MGGAYTNAELSEDTPVLNASKGDRLPGAPEYNISLGFQYDFDIGSYPAYIRSDYAYVSDSYSALGEQGNKSGDYSEININTGIDMDSFTIEMFVMNVTDDDSFTSTTNIYPDTRGWRLRPRTIGVNLGYQF